MSHHHTPIEPERASADRSSSPSWPALRNTSKPGAPRAFRGGGSSGWSSGRKPRRHKGWGCFKPMAAGPVSNRGPTALGTGVARKAIRDAGGNRKRPPARCARLGRAVVLVHADRAKAALERRMALPAVLARIAMLPHALPFPGQEGAGGALPAPPYHG